MFYKHFKALLTSRKLAVSGLFLAVFCFSLNGFTQLIEWPQIEQNAIYISNPTFVAPNEKKPDNLLPILSHATTGTIITVGTERGFITASLTDKIDSILFVDRNEGILYFNQINAALLKVSKDRKDYLRLRLTRDYRDWKEAVKLIVDTNDSNHKLLNSLTTFAWWARQVRMNPEFNIFHNSDGGTQREDYKTKLGYTPYENANYLEDDILFNRIQKLAKNNKIQTLNISLESSQFEDVLKKLKEKKMNISVIDISNAWMSSYMSRGGVLSFLDRITSLSHPQTLLITTRLVSSAWELQWRYEAHRLEKIIKNKLGLTKELSLEIFYHNLLKNSPKEDALLATYPLLDYELATKQPKINPSYCRRLLSFFSE